MNSIIRLVVIAWVIMCGPATSAAQAMEPQNIEARLRAVEDRQQIEQLLMRYAGAMNSEDPDTYVSLFTEDAVFELKRAVDQPPFLGPFKGREALRKQWFPKAGAATRRAGRDFGPMRHVTTNYEIAVNGDAATVRAFFIEIISQGANIPPGSKPPTIHAMGRYEDELKRQNGRWLFSKRTVITDLNEKWEP